MLQNQNVESISYQGYLVFNGIYTTNITDSDLDLHPDSVENVLAERLPNFSRGSVSDPGNGYEVLPLKETIQDSKIENELQSVSESLISLRYYYEEFEEREAQVNGKRKQVHISNVKDVDIFWDYPNFMFFRGPKSRAEETKRETQRALSEKVQIDNLPFSGDFLLWILYKYTNEERLSPQIDVIRLTDSEATGREDLFGKINVVNDSTDISRSVPLLTGILQQKSLSMIEGDFQVGDYTVTAQISHDRVHVKASKGDIKDANPTRRILISNEFLHELSNLQRRWNKLEPSDKYPPLDFFYELYEECQNQGVKIEFSPKSVLKKYATLREESIDEYDFN